MFFSFFSSTLCISPCFLRREFTTIFCDPFLLLLSRLIPSGLRFGNTLRCTPRRRSDLITGSQTISSLRIKSRRFSLLLKSRRNRKKKIAEFCWFSYHPVNPGTINSELTTYQLNSIWIWITNCNHLRDKAMESVSEDFYSAAED